jgi:ubiquinone/menaquinone biosynthesis C-methylase UbiE
MSTPAAHWLTEVPEPLRPALMRCAGGELPANVALMQLFGAAAEEAEAERALVAAQAALEGQGEAGPAGRIGKALALWRGSPGAWDTVKAVLGEADHASPVESGEVAVVRWAAVFDQLAERSPEAAVALYSLGRPELLEAATAELVQLVRGWGLLGKDKVVLDIGCGIGRICAAVAGEVRTVVGIDVSQAMVEAARRRCAELANVRLLHTGGRELAGLETGSFDLVLAVDLFPYLVGCPGLAARHFEEAARVLGAGGALLIFNFSYRGDLELDRADVASLARQAGFDVVRNGSRHLSLWDGVAFHLCRTAAVAGMR